MHLIHDCDTYTCMGVDGNVCAQMSNANANMLTRVVYTKKFIKGLLTTQDSGLF